MSPSGVAPLRVDPPLPKVGTFDPQDDGRIAKQYVLQVKERLRQLHEAGCTGRLLVEAYSGAMDRLIRFLVISTTADYNSRFVLLDHRCSVVAQGGYGRRELSPCSDIDLLLLFPWKRNSYVETIAEKIYYSLLEAGISIGAAARNVAETVRLAARDTVAQTSLLDARYLCGDRKLYEEFRTAFEREVLRRGAVKFFSEKLRASADRYQQWGDSIYVLQPHVKEGKGGLRDIHTASWIAKVKFKVKGLHELVLKGVVGEEELSELERSRDFILRVRNAMHLASGSHQDHLTLELQEQIAPALGFHGGPDDSNGAVANFMREYFRHASTISRVAASIIERSLDRQRASIGNEGAIRRKIREGVYVVGDRLVVTSASIIRRDPSNLVTLFLDAQRHGVQLGDSTRRVIRENLDLLGEKERCAPAFLRPFREIMRGRERVFETLSEMHSLGVLCQLVPEFRRIDRLIRRDPFHIYTVDQHSLAGVRELERLRAGQYKDSSPLPTQVIRETGDLDILYLGILFHDVGKGEGHGHSERGARLVSEIAERMGLNEDEAAQWVFLVRHHLLMTKLVVSRDTHDERLVLKFARTVQTEDNLRKLYLLTFADLKATSPAAWNNWRDMVLGEFYLRTLGAFERGDLSEENRAEHAARVKRRVLEQVAPKKRGEVSAFLHRMPESYLLDYPVADILRHAALAARLREEIGAAAAADKEHVFVCDVRHFPSSDYSEFTICMLDRPGLFASLTGVLAAHQMNIAGARVMTSADGIVLDRFRIAHGETPQLVTDEKRWARVETLLAEVLRGTVDLGAKVEQALPSPVILKRRGAKVTTEVLVDNRVSPEYTVLDVYTEDRPGLLFAMASCLHELGLNIHVAKVTTNLNQVLDVFYVSHRGRKIEDEPLLEEIRGKLRERVEALVNRGAVR